MNESATLKVLYFVFPIDTNNIITYSNKDYMLRRERVSRDRVNFRHAPPPLISTPIDLYLAKHTSLFMTISEC